MLSQPDTLLEIIGFGLNCLPSNQLCVLEVLIFQSKPSCLMPYAHTELRSHWYAAEQHECLIAPSVLEKKLNDPAHNHYRGAAPRSIACR